MPSISRRAFMAQVSAGATVFGLSHLLDPSKALADTVGSVAAMLEGQTPKQGGILTYGQTYPNFALGQSSRGEHPYFWLDLLTRSVWNGLVWVDENLEPQLELATSFTFSDDLLVWDFTLREGVIFHDGTVMTSADVVASMEAHRSGSGVGLMGTQVERIEATGPHAVRFHLQAPNAEFLYTLAEYRVMVFKAADPELIGFDGIGTGPFRLVEIDNSRQFRTVRHEGYWAGGPFLDELRGVITVGNAAINGFRAGQLNAVFNIDPGQIGQYRDAGGEINTAPAGDQFFLILPKNLDFPWNDQRVRQAMSHAIDRQKINEIIYNDPDGWTGNDTHMTGINAEFLPRESGRDLARARALLAEAGYPDGVTLPAMFFCPGFPEMPRIGPIVTESLAEAGIRLAFDERPCDGFRPFNLAVNPPIGRPRMGLVGPRNPFINLQRLSSLNPAEPGGWTGPGAERYEALILEAVATADPARRTELYMDAQRIAQEEVPGIMLGGRRNMVAHRPEVKNARSHSQNWSSRFEYIWIDA